MSKVRSRRLVFPTGGLDKSQGYQHQRPFTSTDCDNVWPESQEDRRERGGSRPGVSKAFSDQISGANALNMLADITYINSTRQHKRQLVGASNGVVGYWESGDSTWTNYGGALTLKTGVLLHAASHLQTLYIADYSTNPLVGTDGTTDSGGTQFDSATFADWTAPGGSYETPNANDYVVVIRSVDGDTAHTDVGNHTISAVAAGNLTLSTAITGSLTDISFYVERAPKKWNPSTAALSLWSAESNGGVIPVGNPLLCTWRDRVVLAGGHDAPQNWHMSKMANPSNWVTTDLTSTVAVSGGNGDAGQIGQPITALIPWQDKTLLIAGENELWSMRGDPAAGGQLVNLSYEIGMLTGKAWCRTDRGELIFLSKDGLYGMSDPNGSAPYAISRERVPDELLFVDDSTKRVLLEYDKLNRKVLIFVV